jgi:carbamate kinase
MKNRTLGVWLPRTAGRLPPMAQASGVVSHLQNLSSSWGCQQSGLLIDAGVLVVCTGGGGIPVAIANGVLHGVEAVIDKDLAAARLAEDINADVLILLTDVPGVFRVLDRPDSMIREVQPATLKSMRLAAGSMGPKAEAACRFVERTRRRAAIGTLEDAPALVAGTAGTQIKGPA